MITEFYTKRFGTAYFITLGGGRNWGNKCRITSAEIKFIRTAAKYKRQDYKTQWRYFIRTYN